MAQNQPLLGAYLVVGDDELKRESVVRRLKGRVPADLADFNLDEYEAKAIDDPEAVVSSLNTMPFAADFRLVVVTGAEQLAKPVSEALVTYLKNPNPACVLLLVATKLAKNTRLYKAVAKLGAKAVVSCSLPKRWELPPLVAEMARRRGLEMEQGAAEELVNRCGESTVLIDNQVGMLAELVGGRGRITRADVEANVAQTAEVSPWAFADAVCERNPARALELYRLMQGPALVFLHSVLVGRLRELVCAQSLAARGASSQLAKELGRAPWQVKNHARWARGFAPGELVALLGEAAACERALKGSADAETAFVRFVLAFASGAGVASRRR